VVYSETSIRFFWRTAKNKLRMQENDSCRKVLYAGDVQWPEKVNDTCMQRMHMGTMDRSFTVIHSKHTSWALAQASGNSCVAGCSVEINQDKPNSIFFTFLPSLIPVHGLLRQKQDYHHSVKAPESLYTTYLNYIIFIIRPYRPMGCSKNYFQLFRDAVKHFVPLS
jgi:hypothetical protein